MIMDRWMPSCREVAQRLTEGGFEKLPWHRRLPVRMHLLMCEHCRRVARQIVLINQALQRIWMETPDPSTLDDVKRRILDRLRRN